ncbi:MAG: GNAT family N-acetyltransferase [bacterium]|nr:GNAT family N-acetyltransferase [bacterium]
MNIDKLMADYTLYERIAPSAWGLEKISNDYLVKFISDDQSSSFISYFKLEENYADSVIENEINYFKKKSKSFEWKVYGTDLPPNIGEKLISHGFIKEEKESFMVFDLQKNADRFSNGSTNCVKISNLNGINDAAKVHEQVWNCDLSDFKTNLIAQFNHSPDSLSIYVIYDGDRPVSSARITYNGDSPFAGLWGGSTLAEYRGKGYYTDLLNVRANEAKKRGIKYLTIDASDMSRPIVEKHGFQYITDTRPYEYKCK